MTRWGRQRISTSPFLVFVLIIWLTKVYCFGAVKDMTQALPDDYLGTEFAWAMVLDLPDVKQHLNYPGSKLWPLTKVTVNLKSYPQQSSSTTPTNTFYEELWYHNEASIGLRRYNQISIARQGDGAIIVCPGDDPSNLAQRAPAIADAIVRLIVDIQLRCATAGLVLVPQCEYDNIAAALSQYNFFVASTNLPGQHVSIHLRAYPEGKDEFFYFRI